MRTQRPVLGVLSVIFPAVGFTAFIATMIQAETFSQMRVPFWSLLLGSVGGLLLSVFAFARRERFVALPAFGLLESVVLGLYFAKILL